MEKTYEVVDGLFASELFQANIYSCVYHFVYLL